jgi:flagellar biosynthetic protein FliQ
MWNGAAASAGHSSFVIRHFPMTPEFAIELLKTMIFQALTIAAPILLTAMVVGLAISLFQAVTTIHEQTLAFVPKALAVIGILLLLLPWIVRSLIDFTTAVIMKMPQVVQ